MAHACYICAYSPVPDGEGVECPSCHRLQYGNACPHCGQRAPATVRDFQVFCSACGAQRGPLSTTMLPLAGQGRRFGAVVSKVAGVGALVATVLLTTVLGLLGWAAASIAFPTLATVLAVLTLLVGGVGSLAGALLLRGSKKLEAASEHAQRSARESALYAFAANRGGVITAAEAAAALNIQVPEADALLTELAREGRRVAVEVSAYGVVHYVFKRPETPQNNEQPLTGIRVDPTMGVVPPLPPEARSPQDEAKERVDREYEQMKTLSNKG